MSWTPHKEAEYHEVQLTRDAMSKEREDYITRVTTPMRVIYNCSSDVDLLREVAKHAGTLRDLLEPFDDRQPVPKAPSYIDTHEEMGRAYARLSALIAALKPLRDWWYAGQRSAAPNLVYLSEYGHNVTSDDLQAIVKASDPGSIVDTHA